MKFEVTHGGKILTLTQGTTIEVRQLNLSLTKKLEHYNFLPPQVKKNWNGIVSYFHADKYIPIGLWKELVNIAKTFNYELEIQGLSDVVKYKGTTREEFYEWIDNVFQGALTKSGDDFVPYPYQIETAYKIITNKMCVSELATGAGKSLIIFICLMYLQEHQLGKKMLMVVPTVDLVIQAFEDFHEYNSYLLEENRIKLNIKQIHGGEKKDFKSIQNIHIGTFQSLNNFLDGYFLDFDVVVIDELHRIKSNSIREIVAKCKNSQRIFGLTGTVPAQGTLDNLTVQAYVGPCVIELKAHELQELGTISKLEIAVIHLDYPKTLKEKFDKIHDSIDDNNKLLKIEQDYVIQYGPRLKTIAKIVNKVQKNQLVLFHRQEYGKKLKTFLEQNTDKDIHLIYGDIKKEDRQEIKKLMEKDCVLKEIDAVEFNIGTNLYRISCNNYVKLTNGTIKKVSSLVNGDDLDEHSLEKYKVQ